MLLLMAAASVPHSPHLRLYARVLQGVLQAPALAREFRALLHRIFVLGFDLAQPSFRSRRRFCLAAPPTPVR